MITIRKDAWWVYLILFFISQLTAGGLAFLLPRLMPQMAMDSTGLMVMVLFVANALAVLLWFCYRSPSITWQRTMAGVQEARGRRTMLVFLLALPLIVLTNLAQEVFFPNIPNLLDEQTMMGLIHHPFGLLTVAVLGPLSEELLFRGGVQHDLSLHHSDQGWFVPIALTAVFFAVIHMNPAQMPAAFILGCTLGFAYWWTGSLIAPVSIHVFNNSLACLLAFLSPDDDSIVHFLGGPTNAGMTALVSIFFLYYILRIIRNEAPFR